jgi:hypothetical protein
MVDYPVRTEALCRHLPASAGRRGFVTELRQIQPR